MSVRLGRCAGAVISGERSHGGSGPPQKRQVFHTRVAGLCTQVERIVDLFVIWLFKRNAHLLSSQLFRPFSLSLVGAVTLVACASAFAADFTDVTLSTGVQLKDRFSEITANRDVQAASQFFDKLKLHPDFEGLVDVNFREANTPNKFSLFFIPFSGETPSPITNLILSAQGPRGGRVFLAAITAEKGEKPQVKYERMVVDRKVEPDAGQFRKFLACSVGACAIPAFGCLTGAPAWLPCFCAWCAGGIVACDLNALLFSSGS
jgi:hypothetical protein